MNEMLLNILTVAALLFLLVMWIKSEMDHAETQRVLTYDRSKMREFKSVLKQADADIKFLNCTLADSRKQADEAQMIADHAIEVISEAKYITEKTIHESRIRELERAFVDRRQREAEARELEKQIDEITGGN